MKVSSNPDRYENMDLDAYINFILHNFSFINSFDADKILKKHYETTFEIFDHRPAHQVVKRPMSGMAALPNNTPEKNPISNLVDEYHSLGIKDILGISFFEYMLIPRTLIEDIKEKVNAIKARMEAEQSNSDSATRELLKSLQSPTKSPGANPAMTRPGKPT